MDEMMNASVSKHWSGQGHAPTTPSSFAGGGSQCMLYSLLPLPSPPKKRERGEREGYTWKKKVVAITTAKILWVVYHLYLSYTWSFTHCDIDGTAFHTPPSRPA